MSISRRTASGISILIAGLPSVVLASAFDSVNKGFTNTGKSAGYPINESGEPKNDFSVTWLTYINGFLYLMGALFMIQLIYAGWLWMTAHGNEEVVAKAKQRILQSLIALGIIISARIVVEFIIRLVAPLATQ